MRTYGSYLSQELASEDSDGDSDCNANADLLSEDLSVAKSEDNPRTSRKRKRKRSRPAPAFVLDVAGGKGDLSWLLKNVDGLESIVLDPWKPDPNTVSRNERMVRSIEYLRNHPEEAKKRAVPFLPSYQPLAGLLPRLLEERTKRLLLREKQAQKRHHPIDGRGSKSMSLPFKINDALESGFEDLLFGNKEGPCLPEDFLTPQSLHVPLDETMVQRVRNRIMNDSKSEKDVAEETSTDDSDGNRHKSDSPTHEEDVLDLLASGRIKLIMGFHPDQATEPCIDLARVLGIPYCVVPCCVFPSEFPDRRVRQAPSSQHPAKGGDHGNEHPVDREEERMVPVRSYHQFLDYLRVKASTPIPEIGDEYPIKIHTSFLDFPFTETAKNIVLYTLPPLQSTTGSSA